MKKLSVYFLTLLLIYTVLATDANIYNAGDFTKHPEQLMILEERDLIRINWDGKDHQLMVRKLYPDKNKVDLTAFIEGAEVPFYATITPKTSLQLDFNRDNKFDLRVSIFNILKDEKTVALKLEKLEKEPSPITSGTVIEQKPKNKFYQFILQNKLFLFIKNLFLK